MATSLAVWTKLGHFRPYATLDLRSDYLRPATPGKTVIRRGECYRITRSISFVRGHAHDGDAADPLAHVASTFMLRTRPWRGERRMRRDAALCDADGIVAVQHALAAEANGSGGGGKIKPINVTVDYMRGGRERLTYARGIVTRLGGRVANLEASAWQDDSAKPIAAARMNYLIVRG